MSQWRSKIRCVYLGVKVRPSELKMFLYVFACHSLAPLQVSFFCRAICVGKIRKMLGVLMDGAVKSSSKQIRRAWCPRTRDPLPLHSPFLERPPKSTYEGWKDPTNPPATSPLGPCSEVCPPRCRSDFPILPAFSTPLTWKTWRTWSSCELLGVSHHFTRVFIYLNLLACLWCLYDMYDIILRII